MRAWYALRFTMVLVVLASAVWLGLREGADGLRDADTAGQHIAAVFQLLYGASALLALAGLLARRSRWARYAVAAWAFCVTVTATLAPVVWGESEWWSGILAGAATLAIAALVVWGVAAHLRGKFRVRR